ncbi:MAG: hypothetical protein NT030_01790 [Candidatus Saganbacteria bacterium]|nr:hypothetical protein [Candidatus Saganbacteria bacterium]
MYKSFQIIDDFVKVLYGFSFITGPIHEQITEIKELKKAYDIITGINESKSKPLPNDFVKYVYPLLEVSVQWAEIKKESIFSEFLEKCKKRVKTQTNFYGTIFEIDMASRCFLSNWNIQFVEDYTKNGKQIDFVFHKESKHDKSVGVECTSKRYSERTLTIDNINKTINEKAAKFEPEYIKNLRIPLDERLLIVDITTENYSSPKILEDLDKTQVKNPLDGVIFTWREDIIDGDNHSLRAKYETFGNIDKNYFSATYAAEIHKGPEGFVFFIRKYIEPEPTWGKWGPKETVDDYHK